MNLGHYISLYHLRIWFFLYCLCLAMAEYPRKYVQHKSEECVIYVNHLNCFVCFHYLDRELIALIFRNLHFR